MIHFQRKDDPILYNPPYPFLNTIGTTPPKGHRLTPFPPSNSAVLSFFGIKGKKREKVAGICGYDSISSAAGFFRSDTTIGGGKKETETNAAGIIVAHNHPSGDTTPSKEDRSITETLNQAGQILGIAVLDHVIVGNDENEAYYSFKEHGNI